MMKKIAMLAALAIFIAVPVFAESVYETGTVVANVGAGIGVPTNEIDGPDGKEKWGKSGFATEVQGLYFFNEYIALGAHFGYNWFGKKEMLEIKGYNFMLDGKYVINPQHAFRVYIPVGVGFAKYEADVDGGGSVKSDLQFAYSAGLGVETNITPEIIVGVEAKYNGTKFKTDDSGIEADENLQHVSGMIKVGYKF